MSKVLYALKENEKIGGSIKDPLYKSKRIKTHGGARKGAGRPAKEPTKVMRIPISKVVEVTKIIKK